MTKESTIDNDWIAEMGFQDFRTPDEWNRAVNALDGFQIIRAEKDAGPQLVVMASENDMPNLLRSAYIHDLFVESIHRPHMPGKVLSEDDEFIVLDTLGEMRTEGIEESEIWRFIWDSIREDIEGKEDEEE